MPTLKIQLNLREHGHTFSMNTETEKRTSQKDTKRNLGLKSDDLLSFAHYYAWRKYERMNYE